MLTIPREIAGLALMAGGVWFVRGAWIHKPRNWIDGCVTLLFVAIAIALLVFGYHLMIGSLP